MKKKMLFSMFNDLYVDFLLNKGEIEWVRKEKGGSSSKSFDI